MKKVIGYLVLLMFVSFGAQAQQVQSFELIEQFSDVTFGDTIVMRIYNPTDEPVIFFPLFQVGERHIPQDVFRSETNLLGWIAQACEDIPDEDCILAMSERAAILLKSDIWVNSSLYLSFWDHWNNNSTDQSAFEQAFAKNYSMNGIMVGSYSLQCGEYAQVMALLLYRNGIDREDLRIVNSQSHVFLEIFHNGKWKIADFDPGTPNFMTSGNLDHEEIRAIGFPNIMDAEFQLWKYESFFFSGDSLVHKSFHDRQSSSFLEDEWYAYYTAVSDSGSVYSPFFYETYDFSSEIILPVGGYLEVSEKMRSLCFNINDAEYGMVDSLITQAMIARELGDSTLFETHLMAVIMLMSDYFNVSTEIVADLFFDGDIIFNTGKWAPNFDGPEIPPYYTIIISPGFYEIGSDIKAPGKVLSVEVQPGSEVYLTDAYGNDTLIVEGNGYEVEFWEGENNSSNFISNKANQYLQQGWIHAIDTVRIRVSWNPVIFNFLHGTLDLETNHQTLSVEYLINGENILDPLIVGMDEQKILNVYPNPTSDEINFPQGNVILHNMYGQNVAHCSQCSSLSVDDLSSGMYILNHTRGNTRIVIQ